MSSHTSKIGWKQHQKEWSSLRLWPEAAGAADQIGNKSVATATHRVSMQPGGRLGRIGEVLGLWCLKMIMTIIIR
jgi:hypothetical protein